MISRTAIEVWIFPSPSSPVISCASGKRVEGRKTNGRVFFTALCHRCLFHDRGTRAMSIFPLHCIPCDHEELRYGNSFLSPQTPQKHTCSVASKNHMTSTSWGSFLVQYTPLCVVNGPNYTMHITFHHLHGLSSHFWAVLTWIPSKREVFHHPIGKWHDSLWEINWIVATCKRISARFNFIVDLHLVSWFREELLRQRNPIYISCFKYSEDSDC